jgi:hypothetical protein
MWTNNVYNKQHQVLNKVIILPKHKHHLEQLQDSNLSNNNNLKIGLKLMRIKVVRIAITKIMYWIVYAVTHNSP